LLVTAQDVIHSWWVPALAIKKDAIPGFLNEAWFKIDADKTGLYRGQCAELCGRDHGFMPIVIDVRSKADFAMWLQKQKALQQPAEPTAAAAAAAAAASAATGEAAAHTG
jgi:cytochrome c oxidase subunit 2